MSAVAEEKPFMGVGADEVAKRVRDLRVGDAVDLRNDPFADPDGDDPALEYEYQVIEGIEFETPTCTVVAFEGFDAVGFPPDHYLRVRTTPST